MLFKDMNYYVNKIKTALGMVTISVGFALFFMLMVCVA